MLLYANGDSHVLGAMKDKLQGKSFVDLLVDEFQVLVHNDAEVASSVTRIVRTTKEYISNNPTSDTFILIGFGTWEREEWEYNGEFYNIMQGWYKHLPPVLLERYYNWMNTQDSDLLTIKSKQCHKDIIGLHQYLNKKNIPHLFFNCMYNFVHTVDGTTGDEPFDWDNRYIGPYDKNKSYYWYLKNNGFESDHWYHFDEYAHALWAKRLINHIKENKLI
jgi:hypothetical protein|tara:strand:+ start:70 stop:726 length:657 start_codon:yes stop_codon:yes gene_type:complete